MNTAYTHSLLRIVLLFDLAYTPLVAQQQPLTMPLCAHPQHARLIIYLKKTPSPTLATVDFATQDTTLLDLGCSPEFLPIYISATSDRLYLTNTDPFKNNDEIYFIDKKADGTYTKPLALGINVNSEKNEPWATFTQDEQYIIFASNRKGGYGGYDLYLSQRKKNGVWGKAQNLGPTINTPADELFPALSHADSRLFFTRKQKNGQAHFLYADFTSQTGTASQPDTLSQPPDAALGNAVPYKITILFDQNQYQILCTAKQPDGLYSHSLFKSDTVKFSNLNIPIAALPDANPSLHKKLYVYAKSENQWQLKWFFTIKKDKSSILVRILPTHTYKVVLTDGYQTRTSVIEPKPTERELWLDWD